VSETLLTQGHHYMHLADLKSYLEADQRLTALYAVGEVWARKAPFDRGGTAGPARKGWTGLGVC
jgi:starch phosphorylase